MDNKQIEEEIHALALQWQELIVDFESTKLMCVNAEVKLSNAKNKAKIKLAGEKMTVDLRQAKVDLEVSDLYETSKLLEVAHLVVKEKISFIKSRLDSLRTLSATNRVVV